jgi:hypothetical protein
MQTHAIQSDSHSSAESVILQELALSPLTVAELKKRVCDRVRGLKLKPYQSALDALVAERKIHGQAVLKKDGKPGKVSSYALGEPPPPPPPPPPPRERAPSEVLKALNGGPKTPAALKAELKKRLPGLSQGDYKAVVDDLVAAGTIHGKHKRAKNGSLAKAIDRYALGGLPPDTFIEPVVALWTRMRADGVAAGVKEATLVAALLEALAESGVATSAAETARATATDRETIMSAVHELLKREGKGALISVRKLRGTVALSKDRFDTAVLELYNGEKVILHHHDNVGNMSEAERSALVLDQYGNYYVGVALAGEQ